MSKNLIVSSDLTSVMRDKGVFRTEGYQLREGFVGTYEVNKIVPFKSRGSEKADNFRVSCKAPNGVAELTGIQVGNARIVAKDSIKATPVMGKAGIFFQDEIQDAIANSVLFNTLIDSENDFPFPEKLHVVGAAVIKGEDNKPLIPMRRYKHYQQALIHHREVVKDEKAFMTRDEFQAYLKATGEARPAGIPENYKVPELVSSVKADDMANWSFTLLLADKAE